MVIKRGKNGLNSGNTIRSALRHNLNRLRKYGFVVSTGCTVINDSDSKKKLQELSQFLPEASGTLEYSLNKKNRWTLPEMFRHHIDSEMGSEYLQVSIKYSAANFPLI